MCITEFSVKLFSRISPATIKEQVTTRVHTSLMVRCLKPRDRILECVPVFSLGVSRMPIYEPHAPLDYTVMIVNSPMCGCCARAFNLDDAKILVSTRVSLENLASDTGVDRRTEYYCGETQHHLNSDENPSLLRAQSTGEYCLATRAHWAPSNNSS